MVKVSVIVPIYNCEKHINKCIDSILSQTLEDIEIILIDDGSSDNSGKISEEYVRLDKRVSVIHQENSGPSVARNKGISIAKGQYIGFVDSDDYIEPTMYEELYKAAGNKRVQVAMCGYIEKHIYDDSSITVKPNLKPNKIHNTNDIKYKIISTFAKNENYGFYSLWNKIYLREWLLESGINMDVNRDHGEDWWFNINVLSSIESFVYVDKELYNYIHSNSKSLMFKYRENQFDLFLDGRLKMKEIMPSEYMDYKELNKRFIYEFSSFIIRTIKEVDDKSKRKVLINNVLNNQEVIESCKEVGGLPIHFKLTTFLIKYRLKKLALVTYNTFCFLK